MTTISNANISFFSPWIKREFHFSSIIHEDGKTDLGLCYQYMLSQKFQAFLQRTSQIVLMAPEEEKTIRRSPLDFPILSPSVSFSGNQTMPKTQLLCLQVTVVLDLHHIPSPVSDVGYGGNF
ncbi:uncharacterized protein LOC107764896 isoform X2 [Nicotiana tabacum]|uniref:Uncharacterized protein LOC107764896 isoform X2 n=1 Tax=Nicotiana tabacum TaxID=4097 RepID=A0A1S3XGL0_TOBAC|nr:uncharacterized protein LOC104099013 isoform X1 [Nicotiana tomentosiformis]XP_016438969.1 PREDICTED: uncharacterized protein LOC107764896 [Nicotiana tabacum]